MELEQAIRTRRTHKAYGPQPLPRAEVDVLLELATWAPNHHLSNPWRFSVLGPESLEALKAAADEQSPGSGAKLSRAPTLVAVSYVTSPDDPVTDEEDLCAAAAAVQTLLLAAHARGHATYWRTPGVLRTPEGRAACGMGEDERAIGLVHLGPRRQQERAPERAPLSAVVRRLN